MWMPAYPVERPPPALSGHVMIQVLIPPPNQRLLQLQPITFLRRMTLALISNQTVHDGSVCSSYLWL